MTIKEVSEKYNISADTIRYYERIGLISPVPRKPNGIRDFDQESCNWIEICPLPSRCWSSNRSID